MFSELKNLGIVSHVFYLSLKSISECSFKNSLWYGLSFRFQYPLYYLEISKKYQLLLLHFWIACFLVSTHRKFGNKSLNIFQVIHSL